MTARELGLHLGRLLLRHDAPVEAEGHAIGHDIGVDPARNEPDRHLWRADAGYRGRPRLEPAAPAVKRGKDRVRRFERVDAGRGAGGMGGAAEDLDLEMKAAVMGVDHRIGEARADRQIRTREAVLEQVARADLAARLLVIGDMQFNRAIERRATCLERQHGESVSRNVRLRHRRAAPDHPAVDDLRAVRIVRPARTRRHHVAMRIERDRRTSLPEPAPRDQVGRRNHAVGFHEVLRNLVPFDLKAKIFQQRRDDSCRAVAISGRIVRWNLHDLGEEARLSLSVLAHEIMDRAFDPRHCITPSQSPRRACHHKPASHSRADSRVTSRNRGRCAGWSGWRGADASFQSS